MNFYCITGGPGVGKTSLLNQLGTIYPIIPEVARQIIREQMDNQGEALPWKNKAHYTELMLERSVKSYREVQLSNTKSPVFFDRSILDTLCYAEMIGYGISAEMDFCARTYRYNPKVFILPPWSAIYTTDEERKQTWEEAEQTYGLMKATYEKYDYQVIEVPKDTVENRKCFVLGELS
ncbi:AAA family ATPase [Olivibacter ginsenosidimutans]